MSLQLLRPVLPVGLRVKESAWLRARKENQTDSLEVLVSAQKQPAIQHVANSSDSLHVSSPVGTAPRSAALEAQAATPPRRFCRV
jgi:hypothetical protein